MNNETENRIVEVGGIFPTKNTDDSWYTQMTLDEFKEYFWAAKEIGLRKDPFSLRMDATNIANFEAYIAANPKATYDVRDFEKVGRKVNVGLHPKMPTTRGTDESVDRAACGLVLDSDQDM